MIGPLPLGGRQAVAVLLVAILLGFGALFAGLVGLRWRAALRRVPGAYRGGLEAVLDGEGPEAAPSDEDDE